MPTWPARADGQGLPVKSSSLIGVKSREAEGPLIIAGRVSYARCNNL